jgi:hypothetical protein
VSEARARAEVHARSGGVDEILGQGEAVHFSHRWAAGQLGMWRPANGLHLSAAVHGWLHHHPELAQAGGWHVLSGTVLQDAPVWLARPWPGWWLINDLVTDGGPHVLEWSHTQPARPRLPFESRAAYEAGSECLTDLTM